MKQFSINELITSQESHKYAIFFLFRKIRTILNILL